MKKIITVVIIAVFVATAVMLCLGQPEAKALTHETATVGYEGPDYWCSCTHTDYKNYDDCCAALGITAIYDYNLYNTQGKYAYQMGQWIFDTSVGWGGTNTWSVDGSPSCTYEVMYEGTTYYAGTQFYGTNSPSWLNGVYTIYNYYPSNPDSYATFSGDASSVNGNSYAAFYYNGNHNDIVYLSDGPSGQYYSLMTACAGPPEPYGNGTFT